MPITIKKEKKSIKIDESKLNDLIAIIERDKVVAYKDSETYRDNLKIYTKQTAGKLPKERDHKAWESTLSLPVTRIQKDIVNTRFYQSYFDSENIVIMKPTGEEDVEITKKKEKWFNWKLKNYIRGFADVIDRGIDKTTQHGLNIFFPYYLREIKPILYIRTFQLLEEDVDSDVAIKNKCMQIVESIYKNVKKIEEKDDLKYEVLFYRKTAIDSLLDSVVEKAVVDFYPDEFNMKMKAEIESFEVSYDGSVLEVLSIDDCWWPSNVTSDEGIQNSSYICRRFWTTYSHIKRKHKDKVYDLLTENDIEDFRKKQTINIDPNDKKITSTIRSIAGINQDDESETDLQNNVEGYECYYCYDINDDGYDEQIVIKYFPSIRKIASIRRLDEIFRHGERPFCFTIFGLREDSLFSVGIPEMIHDLQTELDTLHNQFLNNGELTNIPWGLIRSGSSFSRKLEKSEISLKPGILYATDSPRDDVFFPDFKQNPSWNLPDLGLLWEYIQRTVGSTESMLGQQQYSRTPVGSTLKLLSEANIRIKQTLTRFNRGLKKALKQLYQLEKDYGPEKQIFRVMGKDGKYIFSSISKDELKDLPDFELGTSLDNLNKVYMREAYIMLFQQLANPFLMQLGIVQPQNIYNMIQKLCETYSIPDYQKLITQPNPNPVLDQDEENALMMQGEYQEVNILDDDRLHIDKIIKFIKSKDFGLVEPEHINLFESHVVKHFSQMERKQQMNMQQQQQQQLQLNTGLPKVQTNIQRPKTNPMMPPGGGIGMLGG